MTLTGWLCVLSPFLVLLFFGGIELWNRHVDRTYLAARLREIEKEGEEAER